MVVGLSLHLCVVNDKITFDKGLLLGLFDDRRPVEIDLVVNYEEGVVRIEHIVVNRHAIQVLLEQVLEEQILLLERSFLLLNSQLIQVDLVVPLVEVVQLLELIVGILINPDNLFDVHFCFDHAVGITLVEGKYLLLFGLELTAKLRSLEDLLTKRLVITEGLHTLEGVHGKHANMTLLLITLLVHVLLQLLVMVVDLHLLSV